MPWKWVSFASAEMIENEETTRYILKCNIKIGQDYYFGKPDKDIPTYLK